LIGSLVDLPVLEHAVEHVAPPLLGALGTRERRVLRRRLRNARELRGLREAELADRLAEVGARGLADSVGAVPEVDLVQVEVQDLLLGEALLDARARIISRILRV
jgi:hypothetical protein